MLIHDNRPIKYENNEDAEGTWILKGVKNNGHLWTLWKDNEENRYSELVFFPGGNCEGTGVFDHYGGVYVVADGKINITIAGEQYLNIKVNEAERFYASVTIVDSEGHIDEADFLVESRNRR